MTFGFSAMNYLSVVYEMVSRDKFKAAWLQSPYFCTDLELLYSLHLLTTQEWKDHLKVVYHPLLSTSYANKVKYEKNFNEI